MNEKAIFCNICGQPVDLTLNTVADENGQTVHEVCYVKKVVSPNDKQEPSESLHQSLYNPSLCGRVRIT